MWASLSPAVRHLKKVHPKNPVRQANDIPAVDTEIRIRFCLDREEGAHDKVLPRSSLGAMSHICPLFCLKRISAAFATIRCLKGAWKDTGCKENLSPDKGDTWQKVDKHIQAELRKYGYAIVRFSLTPETARRKSFADSGRTLL